VSLPKNKPCRAKAHTAEPNITVNVIKPQQLAELCSNGKKIDLIDVRTPAEFQEVHIEVARNVPRDRLDPTALMQSRNGSTNEPVDFIGRSGSRGQQACEMMFSGITDTCGMGMILARMPWKPVPGRHFFLLRPLNL